MSAAFDREFAGEPQQEMPVCERCGREKPGTKKRPNKETLCETCAAALDSGYTPQESAWEK